MYALERLGGVCWRNVWTQQAIWMVKRCIKLSWGLLNFCTVVHKYIYLLKSRIHFVRELGNQTDDCSYIVKYFLNSAHRNVYQIKYVWVQNLFIFVLSNFKNMLQQSCSSGIKETLHAKTATKFPMSESCLKIYSLLPIIKMYTLLNDFWYFDFEIFIKNF